MLVLYVAVGAFFVGGALIFASDLFFSRSKKQAYRRG
jgi:hypothetical protein